MATQAVEFDRPTPPLFTYHRDGESYRPWDVSIQGRMETVSIDVDHEGGFVDG